MRYETFKRDVPLDPADLSGHKGPVLVRRPFAYDRDKASSDVALLCPEPTRTQQQYGEETDINTIARNFGITGRLPENVRMPTFGDFCDVEDYQSALNAARWAAHSFMKMPAEVRARFANDPQQFLAFCSDRNNLEEAKSLGLVVQAPVSAHTEPPPEAPKPM